jgi:hypothetical protein
LFIPHSPCGKLAPPAIRNYPFSPDLIFSAKQRARIVA